MTAVKEPMNAEQKVAAEPWRYTRGLKCLTCQVPIRNSSKTDYCAKCLPKKFKCNDPMW